MGFDLIEVPAPRAVRHQLPGQSRRGNKGLEDHDLVFVHIEAPDEASHGGHAEIKKAAIEEIDKHIVGPVLEVLERFESWRILVLPDHPTPVRHGAHSAEPVPFAMAGTGVTGILHLGFGESNAARSGFRIENGCELMEYFLKSAGR